MSPLYPALKRLPFSGFQSLLIADRKGSAIRPAAQNPVKRQTASTATGHTGELLLETICVSPVVFLVFAVWETPGSGAQRRRTGEGLPCCEDLKKTRGESMLEEGAPLCDRLPVDHGRVHRIFTNLFYYSLIFPKVMDKKVKQISGEMRA